MLSATLLEAPELEEKVLQGVGGVEVKNCSSRLPQLWGEHGNQWEQLVKGQELKLWVCQAVGGGGTSWARNLDVCSPSGRGVRNRKQEEGRGCRQTWRGERDRNVMLSNLEEGANLDTFRGSDLTRKQSFTSLFLYPKSKVRCVHCAKLWGGVKEDPRPRHPGKMRLKGDWSRCPRYSRILTKLPPNRGWGLDP